MPRALSAEWCQIRNEAREHVGYYSRYKSNPSTGWGARATSEQNERLNELFYSTTPSSIKEKHVYIAENFGDRLAHRRVYSRSKSIVLLPHEPHQESDRCMLYDLKDLSKVRPKKKKAVEGDVQTDAGTLSWDDAPMPAVYDPASPVSTTSTGAATPPLPVSTVTKATSVADPRLRIKPATTPPPSLPPPAVVSCGHVAKAVPVPASPVPTGIRVNRHYCAAIDDPLPSVDKTQDRKSQATTNQRDIIAAAVAVTPLSPPSRSTEPPKPVTVFTAAAVAPYQRGKKIGHVCHSAVNFAVGRTFLKEKSPILPCRNGPDCPYDHAKDLVNAQLAIRMKYRPDDPKCCRLFFHTGVCPSRGCPYSNVHNELNPSLPLHKYTNVRVYPTHPSTHVPPPPAAKKPTTPVVAPSTHVAAAPATPKPVSVVTPLAAPKPKPVVTPPTEPKPVAAPVVTPAPAVTTPATAPTRLTVPATPVTVPIHVAPVTVTAPSPVPQSTTNAATAAAVTTASAITSTVLQAQKDDELMKEAAMTARIADAVFKALNAHQVIANLTRSAASSAPAAPARLQPTTAPASASSSRRSRSRSRSPAPRRRSPSRSRSPARHYYRRRSHSRSPSRRSSRRSPSRSRSPARHYYRRSPSRR